MTTSSTGHGLNPPGKRTSISGLATNATQKLEKSRFLGLREGTPDSEALMSSEDEQDPHHRMPGMTSNPAPKPARRASWLTADAKNSSRAASIAVGGPFSPISPGTQAVDHAPFGSNVTSNAPNAATRAMSTSGAFPWPNNLDSIWANESSRGPPQRLAEVAPSPTTLVPPGSAGFFSEDKKLITPRESTVAQGVPFVFPLEPTPKTYRSQSYSVGQIEPDANKQPQPAAYSGAYSRKRIGTFAGLQRRPSRPSGLGDSSHESRALGQLREVEDDENINEASENGNSQASERTRQIEQLTRENAMLRQAAAERDRANGGQYSAHPLSPTHRHVPNPDNSRETASSEGSEYNEHTGRAIGNASRRPSEISALRGYSQMDSAYQDDQMRRSQWQSQLGFQGLPRPAASRRHSFAEVPTRRNSIGEDDNVTSPREGVDSRQLAMVSSEGLAGAFSRQHDDSEYARFHLYRHRQESAMENRNLQARMFAVSYFSRMDPNLRTISDNRTPSSNAMHQANAQGQYGRTQQPSGGHQRPRQSLYIVVFKCERADVFYIQEGSGLRVTPGDLVLVEADRGHDLGTVSSESVSWAEAKALKDTYMAKHHHWLMMFSSHGQQAGMSSHNPNGAQQNHGGNANSAQAGLHDVPGGELKPKMIKRLAHQHEIAALREKEGGEAKAKRSCQQKVADHRLRMEILDAEFQMDWKKLTFYYFADSYINFNPLVTDLFKMFKTRIWMSAINTAAIGAPVGNHHLQGNPQHRHYSPEADESAMRHVQRRPQDGAVIGPQPPLVSQPVVFPQADVAWSHGPDYGPMVQTAMPNVYGQPAYDMRSMQQFHPVGHYPGPPGAMPAYYDYPPVRPDRVSNPRDRPGQNGDWNRSFQNLSLEG